MRESLAGRGTAGCSIVVTHRGQRYFRGEKLLHTGQTHLNWVRGMGYKISFRMAKGREGEMVTGGGREGVWSDKGEFQRYNMEMGGGGGGGAPYSLVPRPSSCAVDPLPEES